MKTQDGYWYQQQQTCVKNCTTWIWWKSHNSCSSISLSLLWCSSLWTRILYKITLLFHNTFFLTYTASPIFQVVLFLDWEVSRLWLGRRLSHPPYINVLDEVVIHWTKIEWRWKPDLGREYWRSGTIHTQLCVLSHTVHLHQQQDEKLTHLLWHQDYNFHFCKNTQRTFLTKWISALWAAGRIL